MSLVVTGSIGIDTIETPTGSAARVLGGSCTYFAAAAGFYGPVRLVAAVGDDWPDSHAELLARFAAVDTTGLERRAGASTFRWTGRYLENMNERETVDVDLGVLGLSPPPVPDAYRDSEYIFLANTDPGNQLAFAEAFPGRKLVVADTMDLWINTQRGPLYDLLRAVDALVLNDSEARLLAGIANPIEAARDIRKQSKLRFVIVKKGEHGSILVDEDGIALLPAFPCETVVDPTGAGDSFAGALMGHLAAADRVDFPTLQRAMAHGTAPRHDVVEALASAITETALTFEGLIALIDAREHDLDDEPPATLAALESYAAETSAALTGLALDVLGAGGDASARKAGRHVGIAFALSGLLRAVPFHARARRLYLPIETMAREGADAEAVFALSPTPALGRVAQAVAEAARGHIASARTHDVPRHALAALLPASLAASDLARLARAGHDVFDPRVAAGGTGRRFRAAMRGIVGRY